MLALSLTPHPEERLRASCRTSTSPVGGSLAYLLWDLVHMVSNLGLYRNLIVESATHHVGYMVMISSTWEPHCGNFAFPVLYFGELSSIFLNARRLRCHACHPRRAALPHATRRRAQAAGLAGAWASFFFALTFFVSRVVVMGTAAPSEAPRGRGYPAGATAAQPRPAPPCMQAGLEAARAASGAAEARRASSLAPRRRLALSLRPRAQAEPAAAALLPRAHAGYVRAQPYWFGKVVNGVPHAGQAESERGRGREASRGEG